MDAEPVEMTSIAARIAHKHAVSVFPHVDAEQVWLKTLQEVNRDSGAQSPVPKNSVKNYMSSEQITQEAAATTQTRKR